MQQNWKREEEKQTAGELWQPEPSRKKMEKGIKGKKDCLYLKQLLSWKLQDMI